MLRKILILLMISILNFGMALGSETKKGTSAAQFLKITPGARSVAMGNAFVAVANDASTLYWNPAGITLLESNQVSLTHAEWLADINYEYLGLALKLGSIGSMGVAVTMLHMGEMLVTTVEDPEGEIGEVFSARDYCVSLSYAKSLTDRFSIGFSGKFINQTIFHSSANSIALDIGTYYDTGFKGIKVGMSFSNFGGKMQMAGRDLLVDHDITYDIPGNEDVDADLRTGKWELPVIFRVGVSMDIIQNDRSHLLLAIDGVHPNDAAQHANIGMEYSWSNAIMLRAGYKGIARAGYKSFDGDGISGDQGISFGVGLNFGYFLKNPIFLDYAYTDFGRLGYVQRLSLQVSF